MIVTSHYIVIKNLIHVFGEILDGYVAGPSRAIAIHTASRTLYKKKVVHSPQCFHFKSRVLPCFIFIFPTEKSTTKHRSGSLSFSQAKNMMVGGFHLGRWGSPPPDRWPSQGDRGFGKWIRGAIRTNVWWRFRWGDKSGWISWYSES